jgi:hypothetical protein
MDYWSNEGRQNQENWPRLLGLWGKSGHTAFSPSLVGSPQPSGSALSGPICARNAIRLRIVIRP